MGSKTEFVEGFARDVEKRGRRGKRRAGARAQAQSQMSLAGVRPWWMRMALLSGSLALISCAGGNGSPPRLPISTGAQAEAHQEPGIAGANVEARPVGAEAATPGGSSPIQAETGVRLAPAWPSGTKVLQVGDSFAGALGIPLGKRLEASGVRSVLVTKDASYLTDWAWDGNLQKQLWKFNPDLVLVTLGANELGIANPADRSKTVRKIVSILEDRPCVWVAIPLWNGPQNGLLEVIRENVGHCVYLDTNALLDTGQMPRIKDGVHPTAGAREEWADFVLSWLREHREPTHEHIWNVQP